jgi:selenocysteine lyase/cysteine desulfurase
VGNYDVYDLTPHPTARRFEAGSANTLGIYALGASIELLLEIGIATIQQRLRRLTDTLAEGLVRKGYTLLSPRREGEWSGIVTFRSERHPTEELHKILRSRNIIGARRGGGIRISPHFYNTEEEVLRVVEAIPGH